MRMSARRSASPRTRRRHPLRRRRGEADPDLASPGAVAYAFLPFDFRHLDDLAPCLWNPGGSEDRSGSTGCPTRTAAGRIIVCSGRLAATDVPEELLPGGHWKPERLAGDRPVGPGARGHEQAIWTRSVADTDRDGQDSHEGHRSILRSLQENTSFTQILLLPARTEISLSAFSIQLPK